MPESVDEKIDEFFAQYRLRQYNKGQILILNGDEATNIYYLANGRVKQYDVSYRGDEIIVNVFKPPAFFPMSMAINKPLNPYIYEAETDIEVRQAPVEAVLSFVKTNPDVMYDLLSRVYRGVDALLGRLVHIIATSAKSRLIYELVIEANRSGGMAKDNQYALSINEKEISARAGLSRETVSREMTKLKAEGLVEVLGKAVVIKNLSALEAKAKQEV